MAKPVERMIQQETGPMAPRQSIETLEDVARQRNCTRERPRTDPLSGAKPGLNGSPDAIEGARA